MPSLTTLEHAYGATQEKRKEDNTLSQYLADLRELVRSAGQHHDKFIPLLATGAFKRRLFTRLTISLTGGI